MADILVQLQPIFQDVLDNPNLNVTRASNALTVPGWDSFAHINLVAAIEQEFNIKFALGELEDLKDVGDLVDLMQRKLVAAKK